MADDRKDAYERLRNNPKRQEIANRVQEQARQYLAAQHITLWGQSFDILNGDLDVAADWLVETIHDFDRFKRRNGKA